MVTSKSKTILQDMLKLSLEEPFTPNPQITQNLKHSLRSYQSEALNYFNAFYNNKHKQSIEIKNKLMFNMATGSGKTLMMASLILTLYLKGYRNFIFFVNSNNIIYKTIDNFCNQNSSKYLFTPQIILNDNVVKINQVTNFQTTNSTDINLHFTTIHSLHANIINPKENSISLDDFTQQKVVLIGDEAHHNNSNTKQKDNKTKDMFEEKPSWENTIDYITDKNPDNLLLEFTATLDFDTQNILQKYQNRIIYTYELRKFNQDKYSKNINLLQVEEENKDLLTTNNHKQLILIALLINLYREHLAIDNNIYPFKPVILFKAQKEIQESQKNQEHFIHIIETLTPKDLQDIFQINPTNDIKEEFSQNNNQKEHIFTLAVNYFNKKYNTTELVNIFKTTFNSNNIINVNDDGDRNKEKTNLNKEETKQKTKINHLINTLEDGNNNIRIIFAVNKLNEGWDVLNLYDIVRLYNTRDSSKKSGEQKTGKTTMAEAQLIGRGARYYPFTLKNSQESDDKYQRKFDNSQNNPLQVLENMYYYSPKNVKYISELNKALQDLGIEESSKIQKEIKIKNKLLSSPKFTTSKIYLNSQEPYTQVDFLQEITNQDTIQEIQDFTYKIVDKTSISATKEIFNQNSNNQIQEDFTDSQKKEFYLNDIPDNILKSALLYLKDDKFLHSDTFQTIKNQNIVIHLTGDINKKLNNQDKFNIALSYFQKLEKTTKNETGKKGTTHFKVDLLLNKIQKSKIINIHQDKETDFNNKSNQAENNKYFIYNILQIDSELEFDFYQAITNFCQINQEKIQEAYLIRNMQEIPFYTFTEGKKFYPDFILFIHTQKNQLLQILLESKGEHLVAVEVAKSKFLLNLEKTAKTQNFDKVKIIGLKFFTGNNHIFFQKIKNLL